MHCLWCLTWILSIIKASLSVEWDINATSTTATPPHNESQPRAFSFQDRQDISSYQGYYPYQAPYPPASYGPPTEPLPEGSVHIEFAFDEIVLRCVTKEPFEHIVWTRYQCPQQFLFGGEGIHIADGSNVYQRNLYDVHIRGHDGTIISELLIKKPLADKSEGIYQCEVWPHIHGSGGSSYLPYGQYQSYNPPKSNIFMIGSNSLLEECYGVGNILRTSQSNNKLNTNNNNDVQVKQNLSIPKPRRNVTENRKDINLKQLRYKLKYVNNTLYNNDGEKVESDFFRPSKNLQFDSNSEHSISNVFSILTPPNNLSTSIYNLVGRSNDKFREILPKSNIRKGRISNEFLNSSMYM